MSNQELTAALLSYGQEVGLEADALLLGGSRATGKHQDTSDADVVALVQGFPRARSINGLRLDGVPYPIDLILRTEHDMHDEQQREPLAGTAIVSVIAGQSVVLYDPSGIGLKWQGAAQQIVAQGPIQQRTVEEKAQLLDDLSGLSKADRDVQQIGVFEALQNTASLYLRSHRLWRAKGKIAARRISAADPVFFALLQNSVLKEDTTPSGLGLHTPDQAIKYLTMLVQNLPEKDGAESLRPQIIQAAHAEEDLAIRNNLLVKYDPHYRAQAVSSKAPIGAFAATLDYMKREAEVITGPVEKARMVRSEYPLALARLVALHAKNTTLLVYRNADTTLTERAAGLLAVDPKIAQTICNAVTGYANGPAALVEKVHATIQAKVPTGHNFNAPFIRYEPILTL